MLSGKAKRELKQQAHHLRPVIIIGQHGLTPAVSAETEIALKTHELIKVKINGHEKTERIEITKGLCEATGAELLQSIGGMAIIYRANPEKKKASVPARLGKKPTKKPLKKKPTTRK